MGKDIGGDITWDEFTLALENPHMEAYVDFLGLDVSHLHDIFSFVDYEHQGKVQISDLVNGIDTFKSPAKRIEIKQVQLMLEELLGVKKPLLGMRLSHHSHSS